jgi:hypothetical protein
MTMKTSTKKPFKLNVLGLFNLEAEDWTVAELAAILGMIMLFVLLVIILLKIYAIPILGTGSALKKAIVVLSKLKNANIFKSRSP